MKKTYVTSMPNHIGAFLKASKCFSALGINITRVSYNKAVDSHTLFIDAEGTSEQLLMADAELAKIGYLQNDRQEESIVLIEFCLRDEPGSVSRILELISEFNFNISYISSQENGTDFQFFKMGLNAADDKALSEFLLQAEKYCRVRVIDYNSSERVYDNSIFYNTYVAGLCKMVEVSEENRNALLVHVNLAMQTLDERGLSPYRTFDSISKFAELLGKYQGEDFIPRVTSHKITDSTDVIIIEPPCGSNTMIIKSGEDALFVDSGYALYAEETLEIIRKALPSFDSIKKRMLLTHADVDHCGLTSYFDEIIMSAKTSECLRLEYEGNDGFREENPLHRPYVNICKILTSYKATAPEKHVIPWEDKGELTEPLTQIGFFDFADLHFEVYEGSGGHLSGEIVLIDYKHHIAFTGDIYINLKGLTPEQAEYNRYAPMLMTSVDTDAKLSTLERNAILQRLGVGAWQIFGSHGYKKDYSVSV